MIVLTKLNGDSLMVNVDLIEFIEVTPDTVISMISGRKIVVTESAKQVMDKIIEYKKLVGGSIPRIKNDKNEVIEPTG